MKCRSALLAGAMAAGVALIPSAAQADIRIEETSTSLESTVKRWIAIKGEKRSVVSRVEGTGVLYNAGAHYGATVEIARPDKDVIWELDPQEKNYREVTYEQFSRLLQKGVQAPRNPNDQPLRTLYRSETTAIEVVPTGRQKRIAGFPVEEVVARVVVGAQNLVSGNKFSFTFDQQIWITKDERVLQEVRPFEEAYIEAFGSAATLQQAELMAGAWNDAFINHLRAVNDRVRALGGFPLASTTTVTEEAVAQAKNEKGTTRKFTVASVEVQRISLETVPESEFEVPDTYIDRDTKIARGPAGVEKPGPAVARNDFPANPARAEVTPQPEPTRVEPPAPAPVPMPIVASRMEAPPPAVRPVEKPNPASSPTVAKVEPPTAVAKVDPPPPAERVSGPSVPLVSTLPSNIIVPGAAPVYGAGKKPGRSAAVAKAEPVPVHSYAAPPVANNYPVLRTGLAQTREAPPPVTIDEPIDYTQPKKKRR
jgi:hypothetical protein